jgi:DNA-binding FadR family transcriptional regulator
MTASRNPIAPIQRPPSLHDSIQKSIKAYILDNDLQVGDPLPSENELSRQLNVSRNLVREAVRGLESLGIVDIRRGSGLFVGNFSLEKLIDNLDFSVHFELKELTELLAIRRALETGMIGDAMRVTPPERIEELSTILDAIRQKAERGETFPQEDRRFHQHLFEPLHNATLLHILDSFWLTLNKADQVIDLQDKDPLWTYEMHIPIVDAVKNGDVEAARKALKQHYANLEHRLTRLVVEEGSDAD